MAKKKKSGSGLLVAAAAFLGVSAVGGGIAFAMAKKSSGGGKPGGDGRPKRKTIEPRPGVGGKGKVWVDDNDYKRGGKRPEPPADFDYGGNQIWISPDCGYVIEGNLFWNPEIVLDEGADSVAAALALRSAPDLEQPDNSVLGYVDYMINELGVRQPEDAVWDILRQVSPLCADVDPNADWGEGTYTWFNNFVERMTDYFEESLGAIGFDPDDAGSGELDDGPELDAWEDDGE